MDHTTTYANLIGQARPADDLDFPTDLRTYIQDLADFDRPLATEGAWRLDGRIARQLADETGHAPPGGWQKFVTLAAGTDYLKARKGGFDVLRVPDEDAHLRRQLVEAWTKRRVPPTAAASMFILLGVHPAWGVHLAHTMNRGGPSSKGAHSQMFPDEGLEVVSRCVFGFLSVVFEGLAEAGAEGNLQRAAFTRFVNAAIEWSACRARDEMAPGFRGLDPFLDRTGNEAARMGPLLATELVGEVLLPAGVARLLGDNRFAVDVDVLKVVGIGPASVAAGSLEAFLSECPDRPRAC